MSHISLYLVQGGCAQDNKRGRIFLFLVLACCMRSSLTTIYSPVLSSGSAVQTSGKSVHVCLWIHLVQLCLFANDYALHCFEHTCLLCDGDGLSRAAPTTHPNMRAAAARRAFSWRATFVCLRTSQKSGWFWFHSVFCGDGRSFPLMEGPEWKDQPANTIHNSLVSNNS